jgi:hypothetical protein
MKEAGVEFQMFSPDRFMKAAAEKLFQDVEEAAIEEVKEVRKAGVSSNAVEPSWPPEVVERFEKQMEEFNAVRRTLNEQILREQERSEAIRKQDEPSTR